MECKILLGRPFCPDGADHPPLVREATVAIVAWKRNQQTTMGDGYAQPDHGHMTCAMGLTMTSLANATCCLVTTRWSRVYATGCKNLRICASEATCLPSCGRKIVVVQLTSTLLAGTNAQDYQYVYSSSNARSPVDISAGLYVLCLIFFSPLTCRFIQHEGILTDPWRTRYRFFRPRRSTV